MALAPPIGLGVSSESLNHPPGAPREPDIDGCTVGPVSEEEINRPEELQVSLDPPECTEGGLQSTQPTTSPQRPPVASSHEHPAGGKLHEHPVSGLEVLEAEQDSLHLCLLGLGLQLQDLEQGLGTWTVAHSRMVQLQAVQTELRGAAERVDALLAFGEGLAQRSEPRTWASLEQILRALAAHRDTIFRRLWQLQAQLVSYSLDIFTLGLSHRKHLGHRRHSLLRTSQNKRQASPSHPDVMVDVDPGVSTPASKWLLTFLLLFLLVGAMLLWSMSSGPCCSHARLSRTPYLVLSYVNGPPPV
uniref:Spectrin repeat containing, nuclear envelope family member 4 n=1 Tax=Jaculus jaculus TaxID=51337 RepID=A0A8C5K6C8_JACJA